MERVLSRDLHAGQRTARTRWCLDAPSRCARTTGHFVMDRRGRRPGTIVGMRSLPTILLVLSLPVGAIAYAVAARVLAALPLPEGLQGFLVLFAPLFIAGLVMLPLLVPFFDRKAKQDLAAHARASKSAAKDGGDPNDGKQV